MPPRSHNQSKRASKPHLDYTFRCQYLLHKPSMSTPTAPADDNDDDDKVPTSPHQSFPSPATAPELVPIYRSLFVTCTTFEQILDLGTLRYHLLLTYNLAYTYCAENICLRALYDALLAKDDARQRLSANSCINLFLPTLRKDHAARMAMGPCSDEYDDPYTGERGPVIKLQATTTPRQLGLEFTVHQSPRRYPPAERCMIRNMHVSVLTFDRDEVELGRDMERGLYAAVVAGRRCWVKPGHCYYNAAAMRHEVEALVRTPRQHTIIQLVGFVTVDGTGAREEGEEMVDGVVLRARRGKVRQLSGIRTCSRAEGWRWKSQIGGAVELLHKAAVIWGRAVPENVMIDRDGNALIMDFSGGPTGDTRETDMAGLYQVFAFIDRITSFVDDDVSGNDADGYGEEDDNGFQDQSDDYDIDDDYLADINAPYW